jgi:hypothetical protein
MLIIGVMPTPPAIMTTPSTEETSLVNEPCGPSTQTGWPGLSRLMPRVKSPALRIVNSTRPGRCGDEAIVNGCSSAVTDRVSRSQANWPGAKSQLSSE